MSCKNTELQMEMGAYVYVGRGEYLVSVFLGAPEISSFGFRVLSLVQRVEQAITNMSHQSNPKNVVPTLLSPAAMMMSS